MHEDIKIQIKLEGYEDLKKMLDYLEPRRAKKALAIILNRTGKQVRIELQEEMKRVFDNPTPWTLRGIYHKTASVNDLTHKVGLKDDTLGLKGTPAAKYLAPNIFGGPRNKKRYEVRFERAGILGHDEYTVPGPGVRLNRYGNISQGMIVKMLSAVSAFNEGGYNANSPGLGRMFAIPHTGIFKRTGKRTIKPMLFFTARRPDYEPVYDFYGVGHRKANQVIFKIAEEVIDNAVKYQAGL